MNIYRFIADSDNYEYVLPIRRYVDKLYCNKCKAVLPTWKPVPVDPDDRVDPNDPEAPQKSDFPSLFPSTPLFSQHAWDALCPLIGNSVEALPIIHPSGEQYYAINVLVLVDCLDPSKSKLSRNSYTGNVSAIYTYHFNKECLKGKTIFKIPETMGLEVLVTDEFKKMVETNHLKGAIFKKLA